MPYSAAVSDLRLCVYSHHAPGHVCAQIHRQNEREHHACAVLRPSFHASPSLTPQLLVNIFEPLFEVTKDPESHPQLHLFLKGVSAEVQEDNEAILTVPNVPPARRVLETRSPPWIASPRSQAFPLPSSPPNRSAALIWWMMSPSRSDGPTSTCPAPQPGTQSTTPPSPTMCTTCRQGGGKGWV